MSSIYNIIFLILYDSYSKYALEYISIEILFQSWVFFSLLTLSSHRALEGPTISALYGLLDNYDPSVTARESDSSQELQEQEAFLSAVVATPVMTRTEEFLTEKGIPKEYS